MPRSGPVALRIASLSRSRSSMCVSSRWSVRASVRHRSQHAAECRVGLHDGWPSSASTMPSGLSSKIAAEALFALLQCAGVRHATDRCLPQIARHAENDADQHDAAEHTEHNHGERDRITGGDHRKLLVEQPLLILHQLVDHRDNGVVARLAATSSAGRNHDGSVRSSRVMSPSWHCPVRSATRVGSPVGAIVLGDQVA